MIPEMIEVSDLFIPLFSGELAQAVRQNTNLVFGLYHSLFEWFNPLYLRDQASKYQTQDYVKVGVFFSFLVTTM